MADSRARHHPTSPYVPLLTVLLCACGWQLRPPSGWTLAVAPVQGSTAEAGERAAVEQGLILGARRRGIGGDGPKVQARILVSDDQPAASFGGAAGTVAWTAHLVVQAAIPARPGCSVQVSGRRTWTVPSSAPDGVVEARSAAHRALAGLVADRALDALLSTPECR